jgi:hypothetical protein
MERIELMERVLPRMSVALRPSAAGPVGRATLISVISSRRPSAVQGGWLTMASMSSTVERFSCFGVSAAHEHLHGQWWLFLMFFDVISCASCASW